MTAYRLLLEYDGSDFHGWQVQDGLRTVEGCLREALRRFVPDADGEPPVRPAVPTADDPVRTFGASRTDAGVHAFGQCVIAELDTQVEPDELRRALEALTPPDLGIVSCQMAEPGFHPRFHALEKRYLYRLHLSDREPVFAARRVWWQLPSLDVDAMKRATEPLVGRHDFMAFRNRSKDAPEGTVRTIRHADWRQVGPEVFFQIIGTGFLYKMVRNLVGTLTQVGRGRYTPEQIPEILASRDRTRAGVTAPPQGLYLMEIAYEDTTPCTVDDQPPLF